MQVDEGNTLDVMVPHMPQPPAVAPPPLPPPQPATSLATPSSSSSGPTQRGGGVFSPKASSAPLYAEQSQPECRLAMPSSPGVGEDDGEEDGALKYRKRRRGFVDLARSGRGVCVILTLIGASFAAYFTLYG